jgi:hypothetical protein
MLTSTFTTTQKSLATLFHETYPYYGQTSVDQALLENYATELHQLQAKTKKTKEVQKRIEELKALIARNH